MYAIYSLIPDLYKVRLFKIHHKRFSVLSSITRRKKIQKICIQAQGTRMRRGPAGDEDRMRVKKERARIVNPECSIVEKII